MRLILGESLIPILVIPVGEIVLCRFVAGHNRVWQANTYFFLMALGDPFGTYPRTLPSCSLYDFGVSFL
jgi:hypothetical protein